MMNFDHFKRWKKCNNNVVSVYRLALSKLMKYFSEGFEIKMKKNAEDSWSQQQFGPINSRIHASCFNDHEFIPKNNKQ